MKMPKVSILMPVRNGGDFLAAALESISSQTFEDFECIVVDDGSADGSADKLDSHARADSRFKVFHRPARGIVGALNFGLGQCRGRFIARMDADDVSLPGRIGEQADFLDAGPDIAAAGCLVKIMPPPKKPSGMYFYEIWINSLAQPADIAREIFIESPMPHPAAMIRREAIDKLAGWRQFDGPEDYDLWLRMNAAGMKMAKTPSVLLEWRDTPQRASRTDARYSQDAFVRLKAFHLSKDKRLSGGRVQIWGAGRTGKIFAKALAARGVDVVRFIDINPNKIGCRIYGANVISPEDLPHYRNEFILGAVGGRGARGAREEIREALNHAAFKEGHDYLFVA